MIARKLAKSNLQTYEESRFETALLSNGFGAI